MQWKSSGPLSMGDIHFLSRHTKLFVVALCPCHRYKINGNIDGRSAQQMNICQADPVSCIPYEAMADVWSDQFVLNPGISKDAVPTSCVCYLKERWRDTTMHTPASSLLIHLFYCQHTDEQYVCVHKTKLPVYSVAIHSLTYCLDKDMNNTHSLSLSHTNTHTYIVM